MRIRACRDQPKQRLEAGALDHGAEPAVVASADGSISRGTKVGETVISMRHGTFGGLSVVPLRLAVRARRSDESR